MDLLAACRAGDGMNRPTIQKHLKADPNTEFVLGRPSTRYSLGGRDEGGWDGIGDTVAVVALGDFAQEAYDAAVREWQRTHPGKQAAVYFGAPSRRDYQGLNVKVRRTRKRTERAYHGSKPEVLPVGEEFYTDTRRILATRAEYDEARAEYARRKELGEQQEAEANELWQVTEQTHGALVQELGLDADTFGLSRRYGRDTEGKLTVTAAEFAEAVVAAYDAGHGHTRARAVAGSVLAHAKAEDEAGVPA